MSTVNETFFSRLKDERVRLGFSQEQIADICGTSREVWGRYEKGKNWPGGEVLTAFAKAGADIAFIMRGERYALVELKTKPNTAEYDTSEIRDLVDAYAHADQDGRTAINALVEYIKKRK